MIAAGWQYFDALGRNNPTKLFLEDIGAGLAVAAALELASPCSPTDLTVRSTL